MLVLLRPLGKLCSLPCCRLLLLQAAGCHGHCLAAQGGWHRRARSGRRRLVWGCCIAAAAAALTRRPGRRWMTLMHATYSLRVKGAVLAATGGVNWARAPAPPTSSHLCC